MTLGEKIASARKEKGMTQEMLAEQLQQQKIPAAVIGFLSADNDRVIVNGEERRFLEPANTDAIYRME